MYIVLVLVLLLCGALLVRLYSVEKNLRSVSRQLRVREAEGSATCLRLDAPSAAAEELLSAVNELLALREREAADYRRQEQAIRQQISNVSHDLRTPLTSILGYLQLLDGDTLTPEERREYLSIVRGRAKNLQSLITSFYDLSRLEGAEYPLTREPVDLHRLLTRLAAEFYNDFTDRGLAVSLELVEGLPPIEGDPAAVLRVCTNLLKNALEHGAQWLDLRLYQEGDTLVTRFSNAAPGLTTEDVNHVFERFYTADKTRTGQSTGLGLAIVSALVRRMGHSVAAELNDGIFAVTVRWRLV